MQMELILNSGAKVTVDVDDMTLERNNFSKELTKLKWTNPEKAERALMYVRLEDVSAIVLIDEKEAE